MSQFFAVIEDVSAAERSPSDAEKPEKRDQVFRLNVQVPEFLGKITRERKILLIYVSTGESSRFIVDCRLRF